MLSKITENKCSIYHVRQPVHSCTRMSMPDDAVAAAAAAAAVADKNPEKEKKNKKKK